MLHDWIDGQPRPIKIAKFDDTSSKRALTPNLEYYQISVDEQVYLETYKGVYFICCTVENDKYPWPVYVGMTAQNFKKRLDNHKTLPGGVLAQIKNIGWEHDFCRDFLLYAIAADTPAAKFLESTFLAAFDFARNKLENDEKRALVRDGNDVGIDAGTHLWKALEAKEQNLDSEIKALMSSIW